MSAANERDERQRDGESEQPGKSPERAGGWWRTSVGGQIIAAVSAALIGGIFTLAAAQWGRGSPEPKTATPASSTAATSTTLDQLTLMNKLFLDAKLKIAKDDCSIYNGNDPVLVRAVLVINCESDGVARMRIGLFQSQTDMAVDYDRAVDLSGVEPDSGALECEKKPAEGSWIRTGDATDTGSYLCYVDSRRRAWVHWTYDANSAYAYAYRDDGNMKAIDDWWDTAV